MTYTDLAFNIKLTDDFRLRSQRMLHTLHVAYNLVLCWALTFFPATSKAACPKAFDNVRATLAESELRVQAKLEYYFKSSRGSCVTRDVMRH